MTWWAAEGGAVTIVILFQVPVPSVDGRPAPRVALLLNVTYRFPYRRVTENEPPPRAVLKILRDGPGIRIAKRCYSLCRCWLSARLSASSVAGTIFHGRRLGKFYAIKGGADTLFDECVFVIFITRSFYPRFHRANLQERKEKGMDFNYIVAITRLD